MRQLDIVKLAAKNSDSLKKEVDNKINTLDAEQQQALKKVMDGLDSILEVTYNKDSGYFLKAVGKTRFINTFVSVDTTTEPDIYLKQKQIFAGHFSNGTDFFYLSIVNKSKQLKKFGNITVRLNLKKIAGMIETVYIKHNSLHRENGRFRYFKSNQMLLDEQKLKCESGTQYSVIYDLFILKHWDLINQNLPSISKNFDNLLKATVFKKKKPYSDNTPFDYIESICLESPPFNDKTIEEVSIGFTKSLSKHLVSVTVKKGRGEIPDDIELNAVKESKKIEELEVLLDSLNIKNSRVDI